MTRPGRRRRHGPSLGEPKASPCGGGDRAAIGGGSFGVEDRRSGRLPITPPSVGFADTSPTGGGFRTHGFALSRGNPLRNWEGCEAPGPRPEDCSYEYRFDEDERFAWTVFRKPSDRGFLTRSDGGPRRAECWHTPDRAGDFSPHLPRPPIPRRLGFVPCFRETCPGPSRSRHSRPSTSASRSTTPESRSVAVRAPFPCFQVQAGYGQLGEWG